MNSIKPIFTFILLVTLSLGTSGFSPISNVPKKVQHTFDIKYPKVKVVQWSYYSNTMWWVADFTMNGTEYLAKFKVDGTWIETQNEVKRKNVPLKVKNKAAEEFSGYRIKNIVRINSKKGSIYKVQLRKGRMVSDLLVTIKN